MENFKDLILKGKRLESFQEKVDFFIDLFSKTKYKEFYQSIIILYNLLDIFEDRYQVIFHLFNHFLYLKVYPESFALINELEERKEDLFYLIQKYPLPEEFSNKNLDGIKSYLDSYIQPNDKIGASYYELAILSKGLVDEDLNDSFFKKAIDFSKGDEKVRIILRYSDILLKGGKEESSIEILTFYINELDNNFLQLMYKLASIYENRDQIKAIQLYEKISKYDPDFLDVQEKISKLTKSEKEYKIKNTENFDLENENNIHFL
ncbi:MAG: hypothetical protein XD76_1291 [candidate division TA06 bacterium 32_111]|uniref:Tetratricopeptide repeat protein n=2 Tax=Bacteria candidate phyla TaxID=1783234 RepID=A0A101I1U1_UNCT6|nr:MAG: hypothetical protein XD76_1291 [candidate division TA06 bacterium 32_111]KUK86914.1 MAG: hypothetical protein XE03_1132 [candidate division TA06 bacterium 34_109]HAF07237.1 hypothetical protein [candidate division WOR-3 bacterium]HCP16649.1 hypothetical protein [candidate division WOR-3 bacterium]